MPYNSSLFNKAKAWKMTAKKLMAAVCVAALYSGVRVDRFELLMFMVCGLMAAVSSL